MSAPFAIIANTTIIVALALAITSLMRRRSAALRHALLAAGILAAAAAPLLEIVVPKVMVVRVPGLQTSTTPDLKSRPAADSDNALASDADPATVTTSIASPAAASSSRVFSGAALVSVAILLATIWTIGTVANLLALLLGLLNLRRLMSACSPVQSGLWRDRADELGHRHGLRVPVTILQSDDPALLVACGVLRPAIVLPAGAASWSDERVRIVLAHELAHVRRRDGAVQLAAELLRSLHWFNPLVWMACRRLRQESEYACDDAVLTGGTDASDYAFHLLAVARHARGLEQTWAAAPGITHPSTLERRIAAMLQPERSRRPLTRRAAIAAAVAATVVIIPLAAAGIAPGIGDQGSGIKNSEQNLATSVTGRAQEVMKEPSATSSPAAVGRDLSSMKASRTPAQSRQPVSSGVVTSGVSGTAPEAQFAAAQGPVTPESQARDLQTLKDSLRALQATKTDTHPDVRQTKAAIAELERSIAAQGTQGTIVGSVKDATGAVLPGATVRMTSADLAVQQQTVTDNSGAFMFGNLQPGRYDVAVSLPGFDTISGAMTVPPRQTVGRSFALPLGEITESINVSCGSQAAAPIGSGTDSLRARSREAEIRVSRLIRAEQTFFPTLSAQAAAPIRVGGNVQAPRKLTDARPVCPTIPRTDTTVVLVGRIGTDGALGGVRSLRPWNSPNNNDSDATALQLLTRSATDAVSGWTFTPARLNGSAVEIDATIQVTFRP
jgi:beta-lactamase regulating signal transducer with metallopeptidase domain